MKCLNDELRGGGGKCTLRVKQEYTILKSKTNAKELLQSKRTTNTNVKNVSDDEQRYLDDEQEVGGSSELNR